ncbi:MAG TPA: hypothetical protein VN285_12400 [Candidatus Deferrimicrobium sp.]|nr:hypothetical protein [Candidatus Deferrimicrobium sp.]
MRVGLATYATAVAIIMAAALSTSAAGRGPLYPRMKLEYRALRESNIYHSFAPTNEVATMVNVLGAEATWKLKGGFHEHRIAAYADLDLYSNHGHRNKSSFGMVYEPTLRYSKAGRVSLVADFSRRDKDLIDDAGQSLSRTLKRWESQLGVVHRYDFGKLRTEAGFTYFNFNYDETDTLAVIGIDTITVHLSSYDYRSETWQSQLKYKPVRQLVVRFAFRTEKRFYDARRTYTVTFGAVSGRPFRIRNFRENAIEGHLGYSFDKRLQLEWETGFARRTDNFENFYGYDQWQHRLSADVAWTKADETTVSFRFKSKEYPNYHTSRIRPGDRVFIEYTDFDIEHSHRLSTAVTLTAYVRNYNKVSNDPLFDYQDFTGGLGIRLEY